MAFYEKIERKFKLLHKLKIVKGEIDMFEIIAVIAGIYAVIKLRATFRSIEKEIAKTNERINDGWEDCRTHNAFRA